LARRKEVTSELIGYFLNVQAANAEGGLATHGCHESLLMVTDELRRQCEILKSLSYELLIDDHRVATLESRSEKILRELFEKYREADSDRLYPEPFRGWFREATTDEARARVACDFIAGMTDEYAERAYARIFSPVRAALGDY
jgi:dGTPase